MKGAFERILGLLILPRMGPTTQSNKQHLKRCSKPHVSAFSENLRFCYTKHLFRDFQVLLHIFWKFQQINEHCVSLFH